jgi:anti-sigma regulatory factor (Ser/Thr protein kinase)
MPLNEQRRPSAQVEASRSFRASFDAPGAARRFVVETLEQAGFLETDEAKVVVSELAANAVVHARSGFTVSVGMADGELCISVSDDSSELPPRQGVAPTVGTTETSGGRGLAIVAMLATCWGAEPTGASKRVWAQLRLGSGGRVDGGSPNREGQDST